MKKKVTALGTTIMLGLSSVIAIPAVKANSLQGQRSEIQAGISKANAAISLAQSELAKLNEQIKRVDQAIVDNNNMINDTEKKINGTKLEIGQLQEQIKILNEKIEKRNIVLKERAQSFQETGGTVNYIDVILGAKSFGDFVERIGAVTSLVEADQGILKQQEVDKQEVENKQDSLSKNLSNLNAMKTELVGMKAQIAEQKAQNDAMKEELKQKENAGIAQKADLQNQDQILAAQQAAEQYGGGSETGSETGSGSSYVIPNNNASASGSASDVIRAGYKYIDNSVYVFGGGRTAFDIANGRFDCSGFVRYAFAQAGISVGASTDSLKYAGKQVSTSDMRPGDLVFFNTYKTDGHVAIYIGGGQFIGSQTSTGVAVASMTSGYWAQHFNGRVVRILK
ncbi:MAG TPA: NlpC/P60 family protein [Bacillales bacterium]|nr:NlpC/P60 family protein [Bacillales bacterium]